MFTKELFEAMITTEAQDAHGGRVVQTSTTQKIAREVVKHWGDRQAIEQACRVPTKYREYDDKMNELLPVLLAECPF